MNEAAEVLRLTDAFHQAQLDGDVPALRHVLHDKYVVVHPTTGKTDRIDEWLARLESKQLDIHAIAIEQGSVFVNGGVEPGTKVVRGRMLLEVERSGKSAQREAGFYYHFVRQRSPVAGHVWRLRRAVYVE